MVAGSAGAVSSRRSRRIGYVVIDVPAVSPRLLFGSATESGKGVVGVLVEEGNGSPVIPSSELGIFPELASIGEWGILERERFTGAAGQSLALGRCRMTGGPSSGKGAAGGAPCSMEWVVLIGTGRAVGAEVTMGEGASAKDTAGPEDGLQLVLTRAGGTP